MLFASYIRSGSATDVERGSGGFRSLVALIDGLVLILSALALLTGLLALLGSLSTTRGEIVYRWDVNRFELRNWQLVVLLVVFCGLVALHFTGHRRMRRVSSLLALGLATVAAVAWWWDAIDDLQTQQYISADDIALGGGTILTGFSLGLQIAVGLLMFTAAFPLAAVLSADRTR